MVTLHPVSDASLIRDMKAAHLRSLVAPMDGMWEAGFINPSPHWEIQFDGDQAGYFALNDQGTLLEFYVRRDFDGSAPDLFRHVVETNSVEHAIVGTIDPLYLSLCLDIQKEVAVHTYLYGIRPDAPANGQTSRLRLVEKRELEQTIAFQQSCLGGEHDLSGWLRGYSGNLIARGELFVLCDGEEWLGLGEIRKSDSQTDIVDLGMMVSPVHRGRGLATEILTLLRARTQADGKIAICSTTVENIGAQKAIVRAGFSSRHRILNVTL
jgi:GNAT superfamily N-acetyltransferase